MGPIISSIVVIWEPLLIGAATTIKVAAGAFVIAVSLGFVLSLIKTFVRTKLLTVPVEIFIELFRNIPALTHLFVLYFGLASIGVQFSALAAAILGLGLVGAATLADVFRSGFQSLHAGQREAALAIGMPPAMGLRFILLPQALRVTLPPLANYGAQLIKDTSIVAAIAAPEIMFYARNLVTSTFQTTWIYVSAALIYLCLSVPLSYAASRLERNIAGDR